MAELPEEARTGIVNLTQLETLLQLLVSDLPSVLQPSNKALSSFASYTWKLLNWTSIDISKPQVIAGTFIGVCYHSYSQRFQWTL